MSDPREASGTVETKADFQKSPQDFVKHWLQAINLASDEEKDWREDADKALERYSKTKARAFNVLYANTETVVPALYNSEPLPDVRRRFGDGDQNKTVASVLERAVSMQAELYGLDACMQAAVLDRQLQGRGVTRLRVIDGPNGSKHIECEPVAWDDFRRGPAKRWRDVPWVAFRHKMTREELLVINPDTGAKVELDAVIGSDEDRRDKDKIADQFKRATVWEIWDRAELKVYFIGEAYEDGPISVVDDPYKLREFFPTPEPLYAVKRTDTLVPVCQFTLWKPLADEVDNLTARIAAVINVMKLRGLYDGAFSEVVSKLKDLQDGDLAAAPDAARAMQQGGIERAIWIWPADMAAKVVTALYEAREQAKRQLHEMTGVADILRGSTQASETATAQQIKAQWGSLRLQNAQRDVQRHARDLFRMLADLTGGVLEPAEIAAMVGPELAQQMTPELWALLKNDLQREFVIEIETDSTIRADLTRAQENVAGFVQGFGTYIQSVGPAVQAGMMPGPVAVKLLMAFARNFKLGREAESALDEWVKFLEQQAQQPPRPDPAAEAEKAKTEMEAQQAQAEHGMKMAEMQGKAALGQQKHQLEMAKLGADVQAQQVTAGLQQQQLQAKVAAANMMPLRPNGASNA
jgi:hypothetical protein